jgi:hypothetical protein
LARPPTSTSICTAWYSMGSIASPRAYRYSTPRPPPPKSCRPYSAGSLEHLCRSITRPAVANDKPDTGTYRCQLLRTERLTLNRAGQVVLTLKTPYRDGTTPIVMSPLEFMQRLAALVPRPRLHLRRYSRRECHHSAPLIQNRT